MLTGETVFPLNRTGGNRLHLARGTVEGTVVETFGRHTFERSEEHTSELQSLV